jgi:transposase
MQKGLQRMNVQLTQVLSDITGATGMAIIRAIIAGEREPVQRAVSGSTRFEQHGGYRQSVDRP